MPREGRLRSRCRRARSSVAQAEHTFTRLTQPTDLQAKAFELLDIKLHK
jgi:hypothetical protein